MFFYFTVTENLLISKPLTLETLFSLTELTQYENLTPRFTATVPQCWSEIQQEQQQRRHPQHLHRHGETNRHTRSWKLQHDGLVVTSSHSIQNALQNALSFV